MIDSLIEVITVSFLDEWDVYDHHLEEEKNCTRNSERTDELYSQRDTCTLLEAPLEQSTCWMAPLTMPKCFNSHSFIRRKQQQPLGSRNIIEMCELFACLCTLRTPYLMDRNEALSGPFYSCQSESSLCCNIYTWKSCRARAFPRFAREIW